MNKEIKKIEDMHCPVCGYYCLGKGGIGCIDKKGMYELYKKKIKKLDIMNKEIKKEFREKFPFQGMKDGYYIKGDGAIPTQIETFWLSKLKAERADLLKKMETEIPEWLSTSAAHSGNDRISVECFLEHLERENIF